MTPLVRSPWKSLLLTSLVTPALWCCGGGQGGSNPPMVRVADVVSQPSVQYDVSDNATVLATALDTLGASAFVPAPSNTNAVVFSPTTTTTTAANANFAVANGINTTVFIYGTGSAVQTRVLTQSNSVVATGQTELDFASLAPNQGALDWYVTNPTDSLPQTPSLSALSFSSAGSASAVTATPLQVSSGIARLRAIATGDSTRTVVFDSGSMTLPSAGRALLALIPNSGSASAVALLSLSDNNTRVYVPDQRSLVRLGHFAQGLGAADVFLDSAGTTNGLATQVASQLSSNSPVSAYLAELPQAYRVSFALSGQTQEKLGLNVTVPASSALSVFSAGVNGQTGLSALQVLAFADDLTTPPAGMARVRLIHLAPDLGALDGVTLNTTNSISSLGARWALALAYAGASGYVNLPAGTYDFAVTLAGQSTPLPSSVGLSVNLTAGTVMSVVLSGCQYPGAGVCGSGQQSLTLTPLTDAS